MIRDLLEQYQSISDKIEEAQTAEFSRLLSAFIDTDSEPEKPEDVRKRTDEENLTSLALRALRIQVNLKLISAGDKSHSDDLKSDFTKAYDAVKVLEYGWKDTDELYCDTADAVLLCFPENRNLLLKHLGISYRFKIRQISPLRPEAYFILRDVSLYYLNNEFEEEGTNALINLLSMSEQRNKGDISRHREIVRRILETVVDPYPRLAARICSAHEKHFVHTCDEYAAWFYWYKGCAMRTDDDFEQALDAFDICNRICTDIGGSDSWLGALAKQKYCSVALLIHNDASCEDYLWSFMQKLDSEYYADVDKEFARLTSAEILGQLLSYRLKQQSLSGLLPQINRFLDICHEFDEDPRYSLFKLRRGYNILSGYYLESGDYLQAAEAANMALEAVPPEGTPEGVTDFHILSNLLLIYCTLGDFEKIAYYRDASVEYIDQEISDSDYFRLLTLVDLADSKLGILDEEDLEEKKKMLQEFYDSIQADMFEDPAACGTTVAMWTISGVGSVLDIALLASKEDLLSHEDIQMYKEILLFVLNNPDKFPFLDNQIALSYLQIARLYWYGNNPDALKYLDKCMEYSRSILPYSEANVTLLRVCAVILNDMGRAIQAHDTAMDALSGIAAAWQKATAYLNDHRVCEALAFAPSNISVCYAIRRPQMDIVQRYNHILRFKDLPALVGRERNRILRTHHIDSALKDRIFELQNNIAEAETNALFRGVDTLDEMRKELQHLEAEFAQQFPDALSFTKISFNRISEVLNDNASILEYHIALSDASFGGNLHADTDWMIEVYVSTKYCGQVTLNCYTIPNASEILQSAESLQGILQGEADSITAEKKEELRVELYNALIEPVLKWIRTSKELYVAPDTELCNVPFELLSSEDGNRLEDMFRVSRLVSGRDLLFADDVPPASGALIMGGPDYEAERGIRSSDKTRSANLKLEPVEPLPFSIIEAERIGRRCRTSCYTGKEATKYVLQDSGAHRIIHLATHGYFDRSLESDTLYSACLVFAGANRWLQYGTESEYCGNGLLTADEISRMDLRGTELVVLSACQSSLGDSSYGTVQGLLSGFSAAGVRWVVTHIWKAADFTTPIFMDAFYFAYLTYQMDVPEALQYAKQYLRNVTIGELRKNGWLDPDPRILGEGADVSLLNALKRRNDSSKPFTDEYYWGGFVCHRCK